MQSESLEWLTSFGQLTSLALPPNLGGFVLLHNLIASYRTFSEFEISHDA